MLSGCKRAHLRATYPRNIPVWRQHVCEPHVVFAQEISEPRVASLDELQRVTLGPERVRTSEPSGVPCLLLQPRRPTSEPGPYMSV